MGYGITWRMRNLNMIVNKGFSDQEIAQWTWQDTLYVTVSDPITNTAGMARTLLEVTLDHY